MRSAKLPSSRGATSTAPWTWRRRGHVLGGRCRPPERGAAAGRPSRRRIQAPASTSPIRSRLSFGTDFPGQRNPLDGIWQHSPSRRRGEPLLSEGGAHDVSYAWAPDDNLFPMVLYEKGPIDWAQYDETESPDKPPTLTKAPPRPPELKLMESGGAARAPPARAAAHADLVRSRARAQDASARRRLAPKAAEASATRLGEPPAPSRRRAGRRGRRRGAGRGPPRPRARPRAVAGPG